MNGSGLIAACILVGSLTAGIAPDVSSPPASTPAAAIHGLAHAYSNRSLEGLDALLTADYRFHSFEGGGRLAFAEYGRADELEIASNLFGTPSARADGVERPVVRNIRCIALGLSESADPEHPDSTEHFRTIAVRDLRLELALGNGELIVTRPLLQVFTLVRGDVAIRTEGIPPDPNRWYIRRWMENAETLANELSNVNAPRETEESASSTDRPIQLAIRPLGNPASPEMDLVLELPGTELARIEVFDVTGRRISKQELTPSQPGRHRVRAGAGAHLAPGAYWVRLTQSSRMPVTVVVMVAR
jgi:hypothetical protein